MHLRPSDWESQHGFGDAKQLVPIKKDNHALVFFLAGLRGLELELYHNQPLPAAPQQKGWRNFSGGLCWMTNLQLLFKVFCWGKAPVEQKREGTSSPCPQGIEIREAPRKPEQPLKPKLLRRERSPATEEKQQLPTRGRRSGYQLRQRYRKTSYPATPAKPALIGACLLLVRHGWGDRLRGAQGMLGQDSDGGWLLRGENLCPAAIHRPLPHCPGAAAFLSHHRRWVINAPRRRPFFPVPGAPKTLGEITPCELSPLFPFEYANLGLI